MIKVGKKTTVSENFTKLAAQYEEFQKKINELYTKLHTEEDGLICPGQDPDNLPTGMYGTAIITVPVDQYYHQANIKD